MWIKTLIALTLTVQVLSWNYDKCPGFPDGEVPSCDPEKCKLPDCACPGSEPDVDISERPQIVYLTFDDAMTQEFDDSFYSELFMPDENGEYEYTNPNGCPIRATFFVSGRANQYPVTHKYWRHHHEIAAHSITHRSNTTYFQSLDEQGWADEMHGIRQMINKFANVPMEDIVGMRAPYLSGGGDQMMQMMVNEGFKYDCSSPSLAFGYLNLENGRYPFTYDYYNDMDCQIVPCPSCSFPGIWSQPMLDFEDQRLGQNPQHPGHGWQCAMTDTCQGFDGKVENVFDMLERNFNRSYFGHTRAPIGIYLHSAWFRDVYSWHYEGYKQFLDKIMTYDDVWIVPIKDGIEYVQQGNLTNTDLINGDFEPFNCDEPIKDDNCPAGDNVCLFRVQNEDFPQEIDYRMHICNMNCPRKFPWLGNPLGK